MSANLITIMYQQGTYSMEHSIIQSIRRAIPKTIFNQGLHLTQGVACLFQFIMHYRIAFFIT